MTIITQRVTGLASDGSTKRVLTSGVIPGTPSTFGGDTWGGTWGSPSTWVFTWFNMTAGSDASPASPQENSTRRVDASPSSNITKRVTGV